MSLSFVGYNSSGASGSPPGSIDLTALTGGSGSTAQAGDIVILVNGITTGTDQTGGLGVTTTGYTLAGSLYANSSGNGDCTLVVYYKVMGATPDTAVVPKGASISGKAGAAIAYVIRGIDSSTQMDVTPTTATLTTSSSSIDAPSIIPVTTEAWVLAIGAASSTATTAGTLGSITGYSNPEEKDQNGTSSSSLAIGLTWKQWSGSGSEDPPPWTYSISATSQCCVTLALRPGAGGLLNTPTKNINMTGVSAPITAMWVMPSDVRSGVVYGPTGTEFTGTYAGGGGGSGISRARSVNA